MAFWDEDADFFGPQQGNNWIWDWTGSKHTLSINCMPEQMKALIACVCACMGSGGVQLTACISGNAWKIKSHGMKPQTCTVTMLLMPVIHRGIWNWSVQCHKDTKLFFSKSYIKLLGIL